MTDNTTTETLAPTIDAIIEALEASGLPAKASRDGDSVIVSYGGAGYLRVTASTAISGDKEHPAADVRGKLSRRSGSAHESVRNALKDAGIVGRS